MKHLMFEHTYSSYPIIKRLSCSMNREFTDACKNGQLEAVKRLVDSGADIHFDDDCALRFACNYGHLEVAKFLLDHSADLHSYDDCALEWACENGHLEVVKLLLDRGADIHARKDAPFYGALRNNNYKVIKLLLDRGADITGYPEEPALSFASYYGYIETVKILLDYGVDIRANNDFALRCSIGGYQSKITYLLLSRYETVENLKIYDDDFEYIMKYLSRKSFCYSFEATHMPSILFEELTEQYLYDARIWRNIKSYNNKMKFF